MLLGRTGQHRAITYQNEGLCSKSQREAEKANFSRLIKEAFLEEGELSKTVIPQGPPQPQCTQLSLHKPVLLHSTHCPSGLSLSPLQELSCYFF